MPQKTLFSGIKPSGPASLAGQLHIGNYYGAVKNWVALQADYQAIYCVVDLHAITVQYDPKEFADKILELTMGYLAAGVDPDKSLIFVQSHVPEHTTLGWIFNTLIPVGELERMTQYKEKKVQHTKNINMGLFDYPALMAADILLYKAEAVPVGDDQFQHVELTRLAARKFNKTFGEFFPEPKALATKGARVMGLDGEHKMSASRGNEIGLFEDPEIIRKKINPAKTDPARKTKGDPGDPAKCNLYSWHEIFSGENTQKEVADKCRGAKWGCLDCKKVLTKNLLEEIGPMRDKYLELKKKPDYIKDVLRDGADKARRMAKPNLAAVKDKMGFLKI